MIERQRGDTHWTRRMPDRLRRGAEASGAKLTGDQIEEIKRCYQSGAQQTWLAQKFGVSRVTIWRHVRSVARNT